MLTVRPLIGGQVACPPRPNNDNQKNLSGTNEISFVGYLSGRQLDADKIRSVISETGYEVGDITSQPYKKKGIFSFGK